MSTPAPSAIAPSSIAPAPSSSLAPGSAHNTFLHHVPKSDDGAYMCPHSCCQYKTMKRSNWTTHTKKVNHDKCDLFCAYSAWKERYDKVKRHSGKRKAPPSIETSPRAPGPPVQISPTLSISQQGMRHTPAFAFDSPLPLSRPSSRPPSVSSGHVSNGTKCEGQELFPPSPCGAETGEPYIGELVLPPVAREDRSGTALTTLALSRHQRPLSNSVSTHVSIPSELREQLLPPFSFPTLDNLHSSSLSTPMSSTSILQTLSPRLVPIPPLVHSQSADGLSRSSQEVKANDYFIKMFLDRPRRSKNDEFYITHPRAMIMLNTKTLSAPSIEIEIMTSFPEGVIECILHFIPSESFATFIMLRKHGQYLRGNLSHLALGSLIEYCRAVIVHTAQLTQLELFVFPCAIRLAIPRNPDGEHVLWHSTIDIMYIK